MGIISDLVGDIIGERSLARVKAETLPIGTDSVQVIWDEIPVGSSYIRNRGVAENSLNRD